MIVVGPLQHPVERELKIVEDVERDLVTCRDPADDQPDDGRERPLARNRDRELVHLGRAAAGRAELFLEIALAPGCSLLAGPDRFAPVTACLERGRAVRDPGGEARRSSAPAA